jgi:hypothetical protein
MRIKPEAKPPGLGYGSFCSTTIRELTARVAGCREKLRLATMDLSAFFGAVSTIDFALLGLWWVAVQARPDLRRPESKVGRMAYMVSLQFVVPGTASLLALVDPAYAVVWRVSFAIAGAIGILAILLLVPAVASYGARGVTRFLRFAALPLYILMTLIAVVPGAISGGHALQVEAVLFCLVVFLAGQIAWAAAMFTDPADAARRQTEGVDRRRLASNRGHATLLLRSSLVRARDSACRLHGVGFVSAPG